MKEIRGDSWKDSDDLILAKTVLSHIGSGSTQLAAFEEAGEKLARTASACGFRWNSAIRRKYEKEIREEKLKRATLKSKQLLKNEVYATISNNIFPSFSFEEAMGQITTIAKAQLQSFQAVIQENSKLKKEIKELKARIESIKTPESTAKEDLQAFVQIMNRARSLTAVDTYKNN